MFVCSCGAQAYNALLEAGIDFIDTAEVRTGAPVLASGCLAAFSVCGAVAAALSLLCSQHPPTLLSPAVPAPAAPQVYGFGYS